MALCKYCNQDMSDINTISCSKNVKIDVGDGLHDPIKFGFEKRYDFRVIEERCHDCNVKSGEIHHPGCDVEECPRCHLQLITCGCVSPI